MRRPRTDRPAERAAGARPVRRLVAALRLAERVTLAAVFLLMVALFSWGVFVRELGGQLASDFAWIEEAVRLLNLFLVFGALGLALERGRHVSVDSLRARLPERARRVLYRGIDLVGLLFSLFMVVLSARMVAFVWRTGQTSPTLDVPMAMVYVAPVIGFSLLSLRYLLSLLGLIDRFGGARAGAPS